MKAYIRKINKDYNKDYNEDDKMTLFFLESKGFTKDRLKEAKEWIKTADPDDLMLGEGTGDPFDIMMGESRRPMLLKSVDRLIKKYGGEVE